jgi:hypothetical protein
MGFWSKLRKGIGIAKIAAAFIPATGKAGKVKTVITKTADAADQVEAVVKPIVDKN